MFIDRNPCNGVSRALIFYMPLVFSLTLMSMMLGIAIQESSNSQNRGYKMGAGAGAATGFIMGCGIAFFTARSFSVVEPLDNKNEETRLLPKLNQKNLA